MTSFTTYDTSRCLEYSKYASDKLDGEYYVVKEAFEYYVGDIRDKVYVTIPVGFLTDGATMPDPLVGRIPAWGKYGQAAVVHDWLCINLKVKHRSKEVPVTRNVGDKIFLEAMRVLKVPLWQRIIFYAAVRVNSIVFAKEQCTDTRLRATVQAELLAHYKKFGNFNIGEEHDH